MNNQMPPSKDETPEQMDLKCCDYSLHEEKRLENLSNPPPLIDFCAAKRELDAQEAFKQRQQSYAEIATQADHLFPNSPRENPKS
jgi:hypothetical protein